MPRRSLAASLLLVIAVACTGTVAPSASPVASPGGTAPATGGGGTLVVALDSDAGQLNPAITTSGATPTPHGS